MFFWIIRQIIISLVFIVAVHYIYLYFKNNLTVPKTKDLVKKPSEQYKEIYDTLHKDKSDTEAEQSKKMKTELKNYLKELSSTAGKSNSMNSSMNGENGAFIHGVNNTGGRGAASTTYSPYI